MTPKELLASTSLAAFIGARPPSTVVTVDENDKLEHVLRLFASRDILSAPVIESSSPSNPPRCLGFVGVDDVLRAVLSFAGFSNSSLSPSSLDATVLASSTPAAREEGLRRASERLCSTSISEIQREGDGRMVFRCSARRKTGRGGGGGESEEEITTSLLDVVRDGFLLGGEKGRPACHRVAVCDFEDDEDDEDEDEEGEEDDEKKKPVSPSPNGDSPPLRVVAIVSQSDVVRFLARHLDAFKNGIEGKQEEPTARDLASSPVAAMAASLAFASLFEKQRQKEGGEEEGNVSAAAIVGSLSASDLRGLSPATLRELGLPVGQLVQARARAAAAAAAAAADNSETLPSSAPPPPPPLLAVVPDTPLLELVRLLAKGGHHRAFVVEEESGGDDEEGLKKNRRATGVISLGDILRFVYREGEEEKAAP